MIYINKGNEPRSLTEYKLKSNAYYDGCNKRDIKDSLLKEQGYICAYCMKRINMETTTIEHMNPQSQINNREALDYKLMVGVCQGRRGEAFKDQTCDAHRGNISLTINPLDKHTVKLIKYKNDGTIYSEDININKDLDETLNLNCKASSLKYNRKAALDGLKKELIAHKNRGNWSREFLVRIKTKYSVVNSSGELQPYCGIIISYLEKKLNQKRK